MLNAEEQSGSLDQLAEEFVARYRQGDAPSIDDYARRFPSLADEIREIFPTVIELEQLKLRKAISSGSTPASIGPAPPTYLGDFRIVREIGRGGMGIVYEAEQQSLHRRVALKVLGTQLGMNARQKARFRREAEAAARLHHTNIVPVYGVGEDQGLQFYAMQFIEGVPLNRLIQAWRRRLDGQTTTPLSTPVVSGSRDDLRSRSIVSTVHELLQRQASGPGTDGTAPTFQDGSGTGSRVISPLQVVIVPGEEQGTGPRVIAQASVPELNSSSLPRIESPPALAVSDQSAPANWRAAWTDIASAIASIAEALAHSHHWGVLHRDVKPANLLLDREGNIWITDFGLAKLDSQDHAITGSGDFIGTLRYVAPEQLRGTSDGRSDVYGLGLTLFEWLTLTPAFPDEPLAAIVERGTRELPRKPRSINRAIPADLETITLKACASDPAHRYQSAAELAEDLRRYCDDLPIQARRVTTVERLWRWSRQNPTIAGLGTVSLLLLLSLVTVLGVSNRRIQKTLSALDTKSQLAESAAKEAKVERDLAGANLQLAIRAFENIMDNIASRGSRISLEIEDEIPAVAHTSEVSSADAALLGSLLEFYDRFAKQNQTDLTLEAASIHSRIGDIHFQLGRATEAEVAYRTSEATYSKLRMAQVNSIPLRVAHAECWNRLGVALAQRGDHGAAFEAHDEARKLLSDESLSNEFDVQLGLANTLLLIDTVLVRSGGFELFMALYFEGGRRPPPPANSMTNRRPPEEEPRSPASERSDRERRRDRPGPRPSNWPEDLNRISNEAVTLLERLTQTHPDNNQVKLLLARAYRNRHFLHRRERNSDLARQDLQTAIDHLTALGEAAPESPTYRFELADMLCIPMLTFRPGQPDEETDSRLERAIAILEQLLSESPTIPEYQSLLGSAYRRLAVNHLAASKESQAETGFRRAIDIQGSLARRYPTTSLYQITYVRSLSGLADHLARSGQAAEAVALLDQAVVVLGDFLVRQPGEVLIRPFQERLTRRRDQIRMEMGQSAPVQPPT